MLMGYTRERILLLKMDVIQLLYDPNLILIINHVHLMLLTLEFSGEFHVNSLEDNLTLQWLMC